MCARTPCKSRARQTALLLLAAFPVIASSGFGSGPGSESGTGAALRNALSGLDPGRMPSPILYDRVVPLAALPELNGSPDAPVVTPERWRQALHELTLAASEPLPWPTVPQVRARTAAARDAGLIEIAVLDATYARLRPDALVKGTLVRRGDRLVEAFGARAEELFATEHAFAVTALAPQIFHGGSTSFTLPRDLYLTARRDLPVRLEADFADGRGLRAVAWDQPVPVRYLATGPRELRLRAIYADGSASWGRFPIEVRSLRTPVPTETLPLTADIPFQGGVASGEAFFYLADGHSSLVNPIVVVEGFDLDDSMGWDALYTLLNQENLLEDLRAEGYDAVILDFASATDLIQRNASLLVKLLQTVQALGPPGHAFPVVGASMGGLVSRYALAYMEQAAIPHQVAAFVAFDAPNRGANIPLGLQYWLAFFQGESADAAFLLSRLDQPAARQMLLYHHTSPPGPTGVSDPMRAEFLADLAAHGDFPSTPRLVAIANGSGIQTNQGFAPGDQIIQWEYYSLLVDIIGNIWAVPDGSSHLIFDGEINLIWPLPDEQLSVTVSATLPWDNAPGGYRASMAQMDTVAAPYGDIIALHPAHAFIPTISALGLDVTDPFYDIAGDGDLLLHTSFDAVYFPQVNQEHVLITPENKAWFVSEIHGLAAGVADWLPAQTYHRCFPNPWTSRTTIAFSLPGPAPIRLDVFDIAGRHVRNLAHGEFAPGRREIPWDGRDDQGSRVAAGAYVYRLDVAGWTHSGQMMHLR